MQRVCVIGLGGIGNLHADIYRELPNAELVGICDTDSVRLRKAHQRIGIAAFSTMDEMLKNTNPDMVSIATGGIEYGSDHFEPALKAFEAGIHVLCEKPICNEIEKAEQMVAAAREKNLCFGINLNHRFTPAARLAKKWIDENRIGHLLFMNMSMWIKNNRESSPWFQIKALHPHSIDIMQYFCGEVKAVQCFATKAPGRKIWSTAQFNIQFKNGCLGHLSGSYDIERGHPMERCEVAGTRGRFVIDDIFREVTLYPSGSLEKTVMTNPIFGGIRDFSDTFRNRLSRFVAQLEDGVDPSEIDGSGVDGLRAQKVLEAAIESVKTNTIVSLKSHETEKVGY